MLKYNPILEKLNMMFKFKYIFIITILLSVCTLGYSEGGKAKVPSEWTIKKMKFIQRDIPNPHFYIIETALHPDLEQLIITAKFDNQSTPSSVYFNSESIKNKIGVIQFRYNSVTFLDSQDSFDNRCITISPNGKYYASIIDREALQVRNSKTHKLTFDFTSEEIQISRPKFLSILSLAWSPDSLSIAEADAKGEIYIRNVQTGELLQKIKYPGYILKISWSPDNRYIHVIGNFVFGKQNEEDLLWNLKERRWEAKELFSRDKKLIEFYRNNENILDFYFTHIIVGYVPLISQWSPNGRYLATWDGAVDFVIKIWDISSKKMLFKIKSTMNPDYHPRAVVFSSDNKYLIELYATTVRIWDIEHRICVFKHTFSDVLRGTLSTNYETGHLPLRIIEKDNKFYVLTIYNRYKNQEERVEKEKNSTHIDFHIWEISH